MGESTTTTNVKVVPNTSQTVNVANNKPTTVVQNNTTNPSELGFNFGQANTQINTQTQNVANNANLIQQPVVTNVKNVPENNSTINTQPQQYNANINPQFNPNMNQQFNSNMNQQFNPNMNPQYNQNLNPQFNPNMNPQYNPNMNPQYNPNLNNQWAMQGYNQFGQPMMGVTNPYSNTQVGYGGYGQYQQMNINPMYGQTGPIITNPVQNKPANLNNQISLSLTTTKK